MKKIILVILGLSFLWSGYAATALAGGRVLVGVGSAPFFGPGAAAFFHHRRSGARFFFQFGHHPFGHQLWAPGPWGYYYPLPIDFPYPIAPQGIPQRGFSGTDPSGALYVDGYRALPSGWLRIQVEPAYAAVLVDGFPVVINHASGTSASVGLPVGSHQVEASKAGFQKYKSEVEVKQAREMFLRITLSK